MTSAFKGYEFVIPDAAEAEIKSRISEAKESLVSMAKWKPYSKVNVNFDDLVGDTMQFPVLYEAGMFKSAGDVTAAYADKFWKTYCNPSIWGSVRYDKLNGTFDVGVFLSYDAHPEYIGADTAVTELLVEFYENDEPITEEAGRLELEFGLVSGGMFTMADMHLYGVNAADPGSGVDYVGRQEFPVTVSPEERDYAYWCLTEYLKALRNDAMVMNFDSFKLDSMLYDAFGKMTDFASAVGEDPPSERRSIEVKFDGRYAGAYFKLEFIPVENNQR